MGILDEAIREHLELKRKRGAEQGELRQLEDEAFGPPARPDADPESAEVDEVAAQGSPEPTKAETPAESPSLDRQAIAEQPTEIFDVAGELAREMAAENGESDDESATEPEASELGSQEPKAATGSVTAAEAEEEADVPEAQPDLDESQDEADEPPPTAEAEVAFTEGAPDVEPEQPTPEPEAVAPEPAAATEPEPEAEIFDEQSLSDELDQALEGPVDAEQRRAAFFEETDEFRPPTQRPSRQKNEDFPETSEEDVLEETPDFLEETPEHDRLWFEQKPPKDFDFND